MRASRRARTTLSIKTCLDLMPSYRSLGLYFTVVVLLDFFLRFIANTIFTDELEINFYKPYSHRLRAK